MKIYEKLYIGKNGRHLVARPRTRSALGGCVHNTDLDKTGAIPGQYLADRDLSAAIDRA
jgi:hypothetical protein